MICSRSGDWPGRGHDQPDDCLAQVTVRHADDGAFEHAWLGIQHQFDFFGIDVVSAGNDQIFVAPQNVDVAVFVYLPKIASNEEPVAS